MELEFEYEEALAKEDCGPDNENIIDEELRKLPFDSVNDRVSRLGVNSTLNTQNTEDGEQIASKFIHLTNPKELTGHHKVEKVKLSNEQKLPACENHTTGNPPLSMETFDQLFKNILPAFAKIVKPSVPRFNGNPLEYSKFKAAFKVEVDKKEVYDATEKLKFLLDAVDGSAKSCLAKFMPGSDRYQDAWKALDERFGGVDTVASAAKKRVEQFPAIVKERSEQIRRELIGVYKEHRFIHELKSQIPEIYVATLPVCLCSRWAEFVKGKPQMSTWESFAEWLEKEAKISESKQRWMVEKKVWRRPDSVKVGTRKNSDNFVPGLFVGMSGENCRTSSVGLRCPVHKSTNHRLQECKVFERMSGSEREKVVDEHKLCLSCLLPGHPLSKCRSRDRCKVEGGAMRHHTLLHEVDLKIMERRGAKQESARMSDSAKSSVTQDSEVTSSQMQEVHQQYSYSVCSGCDAGGRALVEVLPVVVFGENGEQRVMALRDSGCNTTLTDENLAVTLGLKGKEMDLEIQGVNSQKVFTSQHIMKCHVARVGKEEVRYQLRDVKTVPNLTGPDQRLK